MSRINILNPHIANQIAAGEVVERPASVIKELVENSIDAGSTSIEIEVTGGGTEIMRVTDNGAGIEKDDIATALKPHATSKIKLAEDLEHIETLGFRGEALTSIAAVSHITIKTRAENDEAGTELTADAGTVKSIKEIGYHAGTSIEVSDLFYNVPARLKFLKSERAENANIYDYVSRMIMARPDISFKLISNGKVIYRNAGDGQLINAIMTVYGSEALPHLKEVSFDDGYISISGYVGTEQLSRQNRTFQTFFLNGRLIQSSRLSFAVNLGYDTRLMKGRYPFFVLAMKLSAREADVNVHPRKTEVRFKDEKRIAKAITFSVIRALGHNTIQAFEEYGEQMTPEYKSEFFGRTTEDIRISASEEKEKDISGIFFEQQEKISENRDGTAFEQSKSKDKDKTLWGKTDSTINMFDINASVTKTPEETSTPEVKNEQKKQIELFDKPYKIIGTAFDTYWFVQHGDKILIIDQHAAHERRIYEELKEGIDISSQWLLMPEIVSLTPEEFLSFEENSSLFEELGYVIVEFGPLTVKLLATPHIIGKAQNVLFLHEALDQLDKGKKITAAELKKDAIIKAACKHAVKAGDMLTKEEIGALLSEFVSMNIPLTCPHGRPVIISMTKAELEKLFKRVQ